MKLKLFILGVGLVILYLLLPIGSMGIEDIKRLNSYAYGREFSPIKFDKLEFVNKAEDIVSPTTSFIIHPSTAISRDGDMSVKGRLILTAGQYYTLTQEHGALDTDVSGHNNLGMCPSGHKECDDTVLISPVSGTISSIETKGYDYKSNWQTGNTSGNTKISIRAEGAFEGYYVQIFHLSNIPKDFKVGTHLEQGQYIGTQCSQGYSFGSHTHFSVWNGVHSKLRVSDWFTDLTFHSSIGEIYDQAGGSSPTKDFNGWTSDDLELVSNRERFNKDINIPEEFKVNK